MSAFLDLMISFSLVLAFSGTIVSSLNEVVLGAWGARGRYLRLVLHRMLDRNHEELVVSLWRRNRFQVKPSYVTLADQLLGHPLVSSASRSPHKTLTGGGPSRELPAAIPPGVFAEVLTIVLKASGMTMSQSPQKSLELTFDPPTRIHNDLVTTLRCFALASESWGDWSTRVDQWFRSTMARASWRYRQGLRLFSLATGFILSAALNLRPIEFVAALAKVGADETLAAAGFSQAVWWNGTWFWHWPLEWLLAGVLIGLGGPFWFDLANRVKGFQTKSEDKTSDHEEAK